MPTISCRISRLRPGFDGAAHRHTAGTIYHVVSGEGRTEVNGTVLEWGEKDVFAVPGWAAHRHRNVSKSADAILMSYANEPVHQALGVYREEPVE
ncbi:cupin domain-containing protein [Streptomyces sp. RTd22]